MWNRQWTGGGESHRAPVGGLGSVSLSVLMIAPTSFFADYGAHVRPLEEIRALQRLGHRVTVCTYHNGGDVAGVDTRRTVDIPWRKRIVVGSTKHKFYLDAALLALVAREIGRVRPDVVHGHLHEGALIGHLTRPLHGVPVLFDYQGSLAAEMTDHGFLGPHSPLRRPTVAMERAINRAADVVVTSTQHAADLLHESGDVTGGRVRCVADAVDTARFRPDALGPTERAAMRASLGIRPTDKVVAYLGLLAPYQGTDILLEAAAKTLREVPEAFFLVMGFPGNERYRVLAERLGILHRVSLPGQIRYLDAHRYLALGDVAVAPKLSETEGNQKIYNYLAAGLPVVAFDTPSAREILGDRVPYAQRGSADSLAAHLTALLRDPARRRQQALDGRTQAIRQFSWTRRGVELLRTYEGILPSEKCGLLDLAPAPAYHVSFAADDD